MRTIPAEYKAIFQILSKIRCYHAKILFTSNSMSIHLIFLLIKTLSFRYQLKLLTFAVHALTTYNASSKLSLYDTLIRHIVVYFCDFGRSELLSSLILLCIYFFRKKSYTFPHGLLRYRPHRSKYTACNHGDALLFIRCTGIKNFYIIQSIFSNERENCDALKVFHLSSRNKAIDDDDAVV